MCCVNPQVTDINTLYTQEAEVLKYSGLELDKELFVYDVEIWLNGKQYKIHTYRCGDENMDDLVLLHGYGGSSALYYPMLKDLSKRFRVFCLDFIGMGLSSRQGFECKSPEETLEFMLGSIEKWREAVGLKVFYLAGHSFGGYISGQYTVHHQQRVRKLFMLSPIGITKHENEPTVAETKKKLGFLKGALFGWIMKAWDNGLTPNKFIKEHPWLGKKIVKRYVTKKFSLKDAEAKAVNTYLYNMLTQPEGTERAIHYILKPPHGGAFIPLEDSIIGELQMPVDCFFGEFDYMDTTGAKRIQYKETTCKFSYKVLPKADHQLTMQNPRELAADIIASV